MSKELIKNTLEELNTFVDTNVPSYILSYIKELGFGVSDCSSYYPDLVKTVPSGVDVPTFNQWMYFYNIARRQTLADEMYNAIMSNKSALKKLHDSGDVDGVGKLEHSIMGQERRYVELTRDILKYTNDGLNRETPRKLEVSTTSKIDIGMIHSVMRKNLKPVIEVKKEVEEE